MQLPGLSNEQLNMNNCTPEAKGYGTYWYRVENIERHGGNTVTTFLILFIVMFKLTFVLFSYELYQRLIKQELYKKTHKRYYTYWSAQVLILGGLIGLSIFADKRQSNQVALDTFWGSVIVDFVVAVVILGIVTLKANPLSEWKCLRNVDEDDDQVETDNNSRFIPPPLLVFCQCQITNERGKRCMQSTKQVIIILANGVSLFLFLAIGSYVAQAVPAIGTSYYVNPTSTLIRLGFFELAIFILLVEISYFIFLCDKLSWLCYIKIKKCLPDELSNESDYVSVYVNECKEERNDEEQNDEEQNDEEQDDNDSVQDDRPAAGHDGVNGERQQQETIAATQPISIEQRRHQDNAAKSLPESKGPTEPTAMRQRSNSDPSVPLIKPTGRCMKNYGATTATLGITAHSLSHGNTPRSPGSPPASGPPGGPPAPGPPSGHPAPGGQGDLLVPGPPGGHPAPGPPGGHSGPPAPGPPGGHPGPTAPAGPLGGPPAPGGQGPAPEPPGGHSGPPAPGPPGGHPGPAAPGPLGGPPAPGGQGPAPGAADLPAPRIQNEKKYSCRWYWLCIVFFQILTLAFMIGVSAPALYFLMQIVIDQTSNSNNDFKDLLSILPTIALNAWLLLKHGDIIHAMKEIVKSAAKQQRRATEH